MENLEKTLKELNNENLYKIPVELVPCSYTVISDFLGPTILK